MAEEKKYIAIVELEEDSALREQWPFSGVCDNCIAWPCYEDCAINKFPMTRQDAIKKIETHLKASTIKFSTTPDVVAEIALNALLEAQNER